MRVNAHKTIDVELEVAISIEDINQALAEHLADAKFAQESDLPRRREHAVLELVNACYQTLAAVSPAMLASVSEANRNVIAEGLEKEARRYRTLEPTAP